MSAVGFRCASCGYRVAIDALMAWRCPNETGDRHHVLIIENDQADLIIDDTDSNPFVRYRKNMAWWAFAQSRGMSDESCIDLVHRIDHAIKNVAGVGFVVTPFERSSGLSDEFDFSDAGGMWIKDETHNVAGSQKARHLLAILLHLRIAEELQLTPWKSPAQRPALAISSCGNAAIAAATLAAATQWPIDVFIPDSASGIVVQTLTDLGARITRCSRGHADTPGDPTVLRFREAVGQGSLPFSVQGPENAFCLDGGRTIGWEMGEQLRHAGMTDLDAVFVQVGGGAFAASLSRGLVESNVDAPLFAVQTSGCAPLARAWRSAHNDPQAGEQWEKYMWPWENVPHSVADGILDDETYDWISDVAQIRRTRGGVVVAEESEVIAAGALGPRVTGIDVSATGTAGLAGVIARRHTLSEFQRVAVVFSGINRS